MQGPSQHGHFLSFCITRNLRAENLSRAFLWPFQEKVNEHFQAIWQNPNEHVSAPLVCFDQPAFSQSNQMVSERAWMTGYAALHVAKCCTSLRSSIALACFRVVLHDSTTGTDALKHS